MKGRALPQRVHLSAVCVAMCTVDHHQRQALGTLTGCRAWPQSAGRQTTWPTHEPGALRALNQ